MASFLSASVDKWISSAYDVCTITTVYDALYILSPSQLDGPLYEVVVSLFIRTLEQWKEHRLTFLRRLLVLAHARSTSSSPIKT